MPCTAVTIGLLQTLPKPNALILVSGIGVGFAFGPKNLGMSNPAGAFTLQRPRRTPCFTYPADPSPRAFQG